VLTRGKRNSVYEWHKFTHETKMESRDHILKWMSVCFRITSWRQAIPSVSHTMNFL
jgi:hypothetical protein